MKYTKFIFVIIASLLLGLTAFGQETQTTQSPETTNNVQIEPKKEGIIRIGVVKAKTQVKQDGSGQDTSEVVRTVWYSFLGGPTVELIPIEARIPLQINVEAEQKGCDYILYSSVSQKSKGSLFGSFIKIAVPILANSIPMGVGGVGGGSIGDSIKQSVKDGATDAAKNMANEAAAKIRAKDQVTLEFNFVKVGEANSVVTKSLKAKAKSDWPSCCRT